MNVNTSNFNRANSIAEKPNLINDNLLVSDSENLKIAPDDSKKSSQISEVGYKQELLPTATWGAPPRLPALILEPDIAQVVTANALGNAQELQTKSLINNLKSTSENLKDINKKKMEVLQDRLKKVLQQMEEQRKQKVAADVSFGLSIAASIFALIGSALLTAISFGAAAPALVGAAVGVCTTIMDGVDRGLKEAGVKFETGPLAGKPATASLAGLLGAAYEAMMVSSPEFQRLDKEEQQKRIVGVQIAVTVMVSVMLMGISVGSAAGGLAKLSSDTIKAATNLSSLVSKCAGGLTAKIAEIAQVSTETANSVATISNSVFGIQLADINFSFNELDNQKQFFEALAEATLNLINSNQDVLESVQRSFGEFIESVSESLNNYYSSSKNIVVNV